MEPEPDRQLLAAIAAGDLAAVRAALDAGADPNARRDYEEVWDRQRWTATEAALRYAVDLGHADIATLLLDRGAHPDGNAAERERTPLIAAARAGDAILVGKLLAAGASPAHVDGFTEEDALTAAIARGHADVAALLVRSGAMVGSAALERACFGGHLELAELCHRTGTSPANTRVLEAAARGGNPEVVQWVLDHGADLSAEGGGALCEAANAGHVAVVQLLLDRGVRSTVWNTYGWTPLHFAAWQNHPEVVATLLRAGADPSATDGQGRTALDWAREAGAQEPVRLLERAAGT